ncbi:acetyltransferase [Paenibacillus sp. ACRRX]|uniref:acetyltransferase n=1 Tax=Paenibacillus sp. ACRRX TaxID=2918206 RepID=UPI001EF66C6B|nr:acetyltransferase [Paenibacillus sp. ACRRX]MCG7409894.1 acetyltransferase [Paenibacillus sp. ACRRX]
MSSSRKTVIIGAGGHAKVIIDILRSMPQIEIVGCIDRSSIRSIMQVPVLGDDDLLPQLFHIGVEHAFVAIGDNRIRQRLAERAAEIGFTLINAISPHANISESASLGSGIAIMPGAIVNAEAVIDNYAVINTSSSIDHECRIGESCHVAPGSHLSGNVHVQEGAFLGTGTTVIDGIHIGAWTVIGAGSVVVRDIPAHCLAYGVPARILTQQQPL